MKKTLLIMIIGIISFHSFGQYGTLDPTFADNGKLTANMGSGFDNAADILVQADGKLIVIGTASDGTLKFLLSRYNSDGTIDGTFGTNGSTLVQVGTGDSYGVKGAFQSDGKIILAGRSWGGNYDRFACVRFEANGQLDESFADGGIFTTFFTEVVNTLYDMEVQEDDKIILGGTAGGDFNVGYALVKLDSNGIPDIFFGENGKVMYDITESIDELRCLVVKSNNKIIAGGYRSDTEKTLLPCLVQFNEDGTVDTGFGNQGMVIYSPGPGAAYFTDLKITPEAVIVAGGNLDYDGQYDFMAAKLNEDGSPQTDFADNGFFTKDYEGNSESVSSIEIQSDGKLILIGYQGVWPDAEFSLLRVTPDGHLDNTFGDNGLVLTDFFGNFDYPAGSVIQPDGKIVVGGSASNESDYNLAMARYITGEISGVNDHSTLDFTASLFPNPSSGKTNIKFNLDDGMRLSIVLFDISGRPIMEFDKNTNYKKGEHLIIANIEELTKGVYFLKISSQQSTNTIKLIKN